MRVSVVIPAFNAADTLERAVSSLSDATKDGLALEVLIVDDGSTDATWSLASVLGARFPGIEVKCLQHPGATRKGVSASRNLGIASATGAAIAFLDADDAVLENRFASSVRLLNDCPDVDAVYETAVVRLVDATAAGSWAEGEIFGIRTPLAGQELLQRLLQGYPWPTCAILCRPTLLARTGGFPEALSVAEDCHLWLRMATLGKVVPGELALPVAEYRRRSGSLFVPAPERYLDFFRMLCSFSDWAGSAGVDEDVARTVSSGIKAWVDSTFIHFREIGRPDLARRLAWRIVRNAPRLISARMFSHLLRGALEANRDGIGARKTPSPRGEQS